MIDLFNPCKQLHHSIDIGNNEVNKSSWTVNAQLQLEHCAVDL